MKPEFQEKLRAATERRQVESQKLESTFEAQVRASQRNFKEFLHTQSGEANNALKTIFQRGEGVSQILVTVHNRDQFYRLVNYCNKTYGKGSDKWTVRGKVLKHIDPTKHAYNPPVHRVWVVNRPGLDLTHLQSI